MTTVSELHPLDDRLAVLPDEPESVSAGGIVIPDSAKKKSLRGTVLAVGPGRLNGADRVPMSVAVGDRILYEPYTGTEIEVGEVEVKMLREENVIARLAAEKNGEPAKTGKK